MQGVRIAGGWILLGICLSVGHARAEADQGSAPAGLSGPAEAKARQTFKEGIEAFDRRDFEAARVAFLQTFALKPSVPVVRRNLGLAEIYSGHYLDGARRLARVLHTTGEGTAEDRARMLDSLKKAEAHLERLTIEVNVDGADIAVDEADLGASPLPFVWYVAPGAYRVRVSKSGFAEFAQTRVARAGGIQHLRVALTAESEPSSAPLAPPPAAGVDTAKPTGANPWLIAAGAVVTGTGLAAGVGFSLAASRNSRKVDRLGYELDAADAPVDCSMPWPGCDELSSAARTHDRQIDWAVASFVTAGVAGVGTLVYALVARDTASSTEKTGTSHAGLGIDVAPGAAALRWQSAF
jgi:hypothetical protein